MPTCRGHDFRLRPGHGPLRIGRYILPQPPRPEAAAQNPATRSPIVPVTRIRSHDLSARYRSGPDRPRRDASQARTCRPTPGFALCRLPPSCPCSRPPQGSSHPSPRPHLLVDKRFGFSSPGLGLAAPLTRAAQCPAPAPPPGLNATAKYTAAKISAKLTA